MEEQAQAISKQEKWFSCIEDWQTSKLSQREYCKQKQLSLNTFGYWRTKFKHTNPAKNNSKNPSSVFQKVSLPPSKTITPTLLKIQYPNGISITLYSEPTARLLKTLLAIEGCNEC